MEKHSEGVVFESESQTPDSANAGLTFVDGLQQAGPKGPPRQYHKKSRNGCQRCKQQRKKCNEAYPVCSNCERKGRPCVYESKNPNSDRTDSRNTRSEKSPIAPHIPLVADSEAVILTESKARRLIELRLFHQYTSKTSATLLGSSDNIVNDVWTEVVPSLALSCDALLYIVCSLACLHILKTRPTDQLTRSLQPVYFDRAIRAHSDDVAADCVEVRQADAICLTSMLLRIHAFVVLQDRDLQHYEPPLQWLQMSHSALGIFLRAWDTIKEYDTSAVRRMIERMPIIWDAEEKYGEANRDDLLHLLERLPEDEDSESWSSDIQRAYEFTLSYIGSIRKAMAGGEESADVCRRVVGFPLMVPKLFVELVSDRQPRALIVLSHYFSLLSMFKDVWWIGDSGAREMIAIGGVVSARWSTLLARPLHKAPGITHDTA